MAEINKTKRWQTLVAQSNIDVWKLVKSPESDTVWYVAKCYIPIGTSYTIDVGTELEDTMALRSEQLYVESIGTFVYDSLNQTNQTNQTYQTNPNIYKFLPQNISNGLPIISTKLEDIKYIKNHISESKTGLWSYKYPWQVLWSIIKRHSKSDPSLINKDDQIPKKFKYNNQLFEYNL
jgi:hypothetical protein